MNVEAYGITNSDALLKNVSLIRLTSGENLISYSQGNESGVVCFIPYEIKQIDSDYVMTPFLPFIKDKLFFFSFDHIQLVKSSIHDYINSRYRQLSETVFKSDIEDLMMACNRVSTADAHVESSKNSATIH